MLETAEQIIDAYLASTGFLIDSPYRRIDEERRATFAVRSEENAHYPTCRTNLPNLPFPCDCVLTELPTTIERAIRSSHRATQLTIDRRGAS